MASETTNTRRRVKLYMLNENRAWDDNGTGHVAVTYSEKPKFMMLDVKSEIDGESSVINGENHLYINSNALTISQLCRVSQNLLTKVHFVMQKLRAKQLQTFLSRRPTLAVNLPRLLQSMPTYLPDLLPLYVPARALRLFQNDHLAVHSNITLSVLSLLLALSGSLLLNFRIIYHTPSKPPPLKLHCFFKSRLKTHLFDQAFTLQ